MKLYTAVVWSISLKRKIRLVYLVKSSESNSNSYAVLFSTDLELDAYSIYLYYKARFQIERGGCWGFPSLSNHVVEFLFRDSKQFTGLADCQARDLSKLDFHFNSSLTALNLAKWDAVQQHDSDTDFVFSMASYKRRALNHHLLELFIDQLGLEPTLIKSHPNYYKLYDYGTIAA